MLLRRGGSDIRQRWLWPNGVEAEKNASGVQQGVVIFSFYNC